MRRALEIAAFATLVIVAVLLPNEAEARRGIAIINYGETVKHVGEVAAGLESPVPDAQVGYIHNRFGAFWLDVWTWDGRYCLFKDDGYWELEPEQAATLLGVPFADLKNPFLYTVPPGLLAIVVLAVGALIYNTVAAKKEKQVGQLFGDERYKRALEIIEKRVSETEKDATPATGQKTAFDVGFEEAVEYLAGEGIARPEAQAQLASMVNAVVASREAATG